MVEMTVGVDDAADAQPEGGDGGNDLFRLGAGIDHYSLSGFLAAEDEAVDPQWADNDRLENHKRDSLFSPPAGSSPIVGGGRRPGEGISRINPGSCSSVPR